MPPQFQALFDSVRRFHGKLDVQQRRGLGYGVVVMAASAALLAVVWMYEPYGVLFRDLEPAEAGAIVDKLKTMTVPHRLADAGRTIEVPEGKVHETRLALAKEGAVGQVASGYELLDNVPFGTSELAMRLRQRRALEGELARTIASIHGIRSARVHLTTPERSLFADTARKPTASVVTTLTAGRSLSRDEVNGIRSLVAHAVEGMGEESVTIVDDRGRMLTSSEQSTGGGMELDRRHLLEQQLEQRIVTMLEPVVGLDKVNARVTVEFDETSLVETNKTFDPDKSAVRSEESNEEERTVGSSPRGVAGAQANAPGAGMTTTQGDNSVGRSERAVTNYEVSVTTRETKRDVGAMKRVSAAVLVGGRKIESPAGSGKLVDEPLPAVELERLREIVKGAIGFSAVRGDVVQIDSMTFLATPEPEPGLQALLPQLLPAAKVLGVALLALVLFFVVLRPLLKAARSVQAAEGSRAETLAALGPAARVDVAALRPASADSPGALPQPSDSMQARRDRALEAALDRSDRAAEIVRAWLAAEPAKVVAGGREAAP